MKSILQIKEASIASKPITTPLGTPEFAVLMESCAPTSANFAVAVSGGSDSMALAYCLRRWLGEKENGGKLMAFIVDHALRAESVVEAREVQKTLASIGLKSAILTWQHAPVVSALHDAARRARYRLLIEACQKHGVHDLFFAHQREDQAETILMRLAKGSGVDGLAGMRAQSMREGVRILRPLLTVSRDRLVATCTAAGLSFVSDISNRSEKYARGRLRKVLPLLAAEGLTIESLCDLGMHAAEAKDALDQSTAALLRVAVLADEYGALRLRLEHLRAAPRAIALRALSACLQTVHPDDYAPPHASLTRLFDALCSDGDMRSCTLHGCFISKNNNESIITRECAAIAEELSIAPGETVLWDKRWQVSLGANEVKNLTIRPLGNPPHELVDKLAPGLRRAVPQGRIRACLPALWLKGVLALIPALPPNIKESAASARLQSRIGPKGL